jgi:hypothetical protein
MAWGRQFDLPYSVELWDDADSHVEELIASAISAARISGVREAFVLYPENIETELVTLEKFLIAEATPTALRVRFAPSLRPLMHPAWLIAIDEFIEVAALNWLLLEREMHVGAQVINPEPLGPCLGAAVLLVEEEDLPVESHSPNPCTAATAASGFLQ